MSTAAGRAGTCAMCERRFPRGAQIVRYKDGWAHADCGAEWLKSAAGSWTKCGSCGQRKPLSEFTRKRKPSKRTGRHRKPYQVTTCNACRGAGHGQGQFPGKAAGQVWNLKCWRCGELLTREEHWEHKNEVWTFHPRCTDCRQWFPNSGRLEPAPP